MTFKAIIFDFDGVITNTEPVHMQAWLDVLGDIDIFFNQEEYNNHYIGLNDRDFLDVVGRIHNVNFSDSKKPEFISKKIIHSIKLLEKNIPVFSDTARFIRETSKQYLLSIYSGATKKEIEFMLEKLGWSNLFNPIITQEDVKKGKPNPEGYLLAMQLISKRLPNKTIKPQDCVVIEDSPKGIEAAHAAGMKCIAITNSFGRDILSKADLVVKSLSADILNQF